jgi:hypothetical protein
MLRILAAFLLGFSFLVVTVPALANRNHKIEAFCQCISLDHDISEMHYVTVDAEDGMQISSKYIKGYSGAWALEQCQADLEKEWLCR